MRVILISCVYPPEPVTSATTSAALADGLVEAGHDVTVITAFPSRPEGCLYAGYRRSFRRISKESERFRLIRTFATVSKHSTVLSRVLENTSFGICSSINSIFIGADVAYFNTWPIIAGSMSSALARLRSIPYVLSIQDIHPEAIIEQGKLSPSSLSARTMRVIDRWVARNAKHVVTISQNFADFYQLNRGISPERISVVPNWMDENAIAPRTRNNPFRERLKIAENTFVAMYAGNVGTTADIPTLLKSAELLRDESRILFVIAGDGSLRKAFEKDATTRRLSNIRFHYPLSQEEFCNAQGASDLMLLPMRHGGALNSVPSKMIAYMLSSRPILAAVDTQSDSARIISQAECGWVVPPEDPIALTEKLLQILVTKDLTNSGARGRAYAENNFTARTSVPKLIRIIEEAARK